MNEIELDKIFLKKHYESNANLDISLKEQLLKDKIGGHNRSDKKLNLEAINTLRFCLESRTIDPENSSSIGGLHYENPFDEFDQNKIKEKMFELIKKL